jgi:hypothetical protein
MYLAESLNFLMFLKYLLKKLLRYLFMAIGAFPADEGSVLNNIQKVWH